MKTMILNDSGMDITEVNFEKWVLGITQELTKRKILPTEKKEKELALVFLNENDAKRLNWSYRCKDYPTDILSFSSDDPESIGELVMCPQIITRQAKEHGISFDEEMGYIVLHGVLHLLGYEHEKNKEDEKVMMAIQDEVFEKLRKPEKKQNKENKENKTVPKLKMVKEKVEAKKTVKQKNDATRGLKVKSKLKAEPAKVIEKKEAKSTKAISSKKSQLKTIDKKNKAVNTKKVKK